MDPQIKKILNQTVIWKKASVPSGMGDITYGTPVSLKGYVAGKTTILLDEAGAEITSLFAVYFNEISGPLISTNDLLTLPSGRTSKVLSTRVLYAQDGELDYVEVLL
jgi:hypothetical protein